MAFIWTTMLPFVIVLATFGMSIGIAKALHFEDFRAQMLVWGIVNTCLYAADVLSAPIFFISLIPTILLIALDQKRKGASQSA